MNIKHLILFGFLFLLFSCQDTDSSGTQSAGRSTAAGPLFQKVATADSGVDFVNDIQENAKFNHLKWTSIYNGSGVAIGDINNDGLPDIYFGKNTGQDRLYLNKGDLQFEDITSTALPKDTRWTAGISMVDINNDGLLDIYLSKFGYTISDTQHRNFFFINQGDNTFVEKGVEMGLGDCGFTTQTVFFDFDKDGDLDAYVINQPPDKRQIKAEHANNYLYSDHFYLNEGNLKFRDATQELGLKNYAFGLNGMVLDANEDGWLDIYISNDYEAPDYLYINQQGKGFKNELESRFKHISNFSMGSDVADINNDGHFDLSVLDMSSSDHYRSKTNMGAMNEKDFWASVNAGNYYQYMFNTLQLNQGNGHFSDIGHMTGVANTDWSWSVLMEDFDANGFSDMFVTNGIKRDIRNNDFLQVIRKENEAGNNKFKIAELLEKIPSNPISNFAFSNQGDLQFEDVTKAWGLFEPNFCSGAAYGDLDGDGDLDLVVNVTDAPADIYENKTAADKTLKVTIDPAVRNELMHASFTLNDGAGSDIMHRMLTPVRGYLSSVEPNIIFGLGGQSIHQLIINTNRGKTYVVDVRGKNKISLDATTLTEGKAPMADAKGILLKSIQPNSKYVHRENDYNDFEKEILLPHKLSENGPFLASLGGNEFLVGGSAGSAAKKINLSNGQAQESNPFAQLKENQQLTTFDADGDGDLDVYVCNGGNEFSAGNKKLNDDFYINQGNNKYQLSNQNIPAQASSTSKAIAIDINNDKQMDLFVCGRNLPGLYPQASASYLLINNNGQFKLQAIDETLQEALGMITDGAAQDIDGDGDQDLLVAGEWMAPVLLENQDGQLVKKELGQADQLKSWWMHVQAADFNGDGKMDFLLGSMGENNKFHPGLEHPLRVFAQDFDENGTNDIVLAKDYQGKVVPVRGRECSSQQMPFVADKFPSYDGFAKADIFEIYGEDKLEASNAFEVNTMSHILLLNLGDWKFAMNKLPAAAQIAPMKSSLVIDLNGDGLKDILAVGNHYGAEVETTRYDAGYGVTLLNTGEGNFKAIPISESGFFVQGDARDIIQLADGTIVVSVNQGPLQFFK